MNIAYVKSEFVNEVLLIKQLQLPLKVYLIVRFFQLNFFCGLFSIGAYDIITISENKYTKNISALNAE